MQLSGKESISTFHFSANNKAGSGSSGQRSHGMKGTFRNGTFFDDDEPPQMRDIQYDLSPEKMEKIWVINA